MEYNSNSGRILIKGTSDFILFDGTLHYGVERIDMEGNNDPDYEVYKFPFDWEIKDSKVDSNTRVFEMTMKKKCPLVGSFIWWKNVLKGDPEIDISKIQGRSEAQLQKTQDTWNLAQEMFREKMKKERSKV